METILKCSVCLEIFENPRVLPCQHTFCFQCLTGIAKSRRGVVVCPQCRKHYPVPWEGVESFPANFFIKNVLDLMNDGSLVSNENTCSSCASNDLASCRCLFCGEFLCKDCASKHKKQKQDEGDDSADEKHQIAELSFLRNASSSKPKSYSICSKHSDEILKYHCENCDRVICRDCSVFEHREHNVILLKDALKELKGAVSSILEEGRSRIPHIRKALENAGSLSQQLKHQHESTATRIKETKQKHLEELKKSLDTREEELLGELQEWFDKGNTKLQERQHELELELGLMMSSCDFAENKLKTLEQEDNFSSKKEILDSLKGIELGEISREEAAKAEVFWQYSDNKMSASLKEETQKAMGCLVLHSSFESCTETPDYAEASPGNLDESSSSSQFAEGHADCLDESSSSSQFAEAHADCLDESSSSSQFAEAHADGLDESTDSFQTAIFASPEDEPYTVSSLQGLYTQLISIYPDHSVSSPRTHCNICGRNNHDDSNCRAKYDVQNRLIRHGEICYQCGKEGHWAKDCLDSSSSSSESWLTVEDLDSDDEPEAFYSQYTETSCTRCGRTNHNISQCYARYSVNGRRLSASGDYENGCSRCGRRNHHVSSCHARYSVNGRRL